MLCASRLCLIAQNDYQTDLLARMASKLKITEQLDTLKDNVYQDLFLYKGRPLTIIVNNHRVEHIGFHLFTNEHRDVFHTPVINFVERYFLELDLGVDSIFSNKEKMEYDNVKFHKGNASFFYNLPNDSLYQISYSVSIMNFDNRGYSVEWLKDSAVVCGISFPIEYAVLSGTDMIEYQERFRNEIERDTLKMPELPDIPESALDFKLLENYYVLEGDSFYNEYLNSNQYYVKDSVGHLAPLFDSLYVVESLHNLFTMPYLDNSYTIEARLQKYHNKEEIMRIPLKQWIRFCFNNGCHPYFGIIRIVDNIVTCELIMQNTDMGYVHVMKLNYDLSTFESRSGIITARLNCYIPMTRIKYLFGEIKK